MLCIPNCLIHPFCITSHRPTPLHRTGSQTIDIVAHTWHASGQPQFSQEDQKCFRNASGLLIFQYNFQFSIQQSIVLDTCSLDQRIVYILFPTFECVHPVIISISSRNSNTNDIKTMLSILYKRVQLLLTFCLSRSRSAFLLRVIEISA